MSAQIHGSGIDSLFEALPTTSSGKVDRKGDEKERWKGRRIQTVRILEIGMFYEPDRGPALPSARCSARAGHQGISHGSRRGAHYPNRTGSESVPRQMAPDDG
jgi:hypothetical protein